MKGNIKNMIRKILFIDAEESKAATGVKMQWGHHPLGVLYLASYIKKSYPDMKMQVFHTLTSEDINKDLSNIIADFQPDLVGIRSLSHFKQQMKDIALFVKKNIPDIPLIAGGPYPSVSYTEVLEDPNIDIVIIGEGEATLLEIIDYWQNKKDIPKNISGTAVMDGKSVKVNKKRSFLDVNLIPYPDHSLIDLKMYSHVYNQAFIPSDDCAYIFSSRGCPYKCYYCHNLFGKNVRRRTAQNIAGEIKTYIEDKGIKKFVFVDDIFNVPLENGKHVLKYLIHEFKNENLKLYFPNGLRVDCIDDEFIDLLKMANTQHVSLAVETASTRLQKEIQKNLDLKKAKINIEKISRDIITTVLFMVGFPSETYEEANDTILFAEQLKYVVQPVLSILRVYPHTPVYNLLKISKDQDEALKLQAAMELSPNIFEGESLEAAPGFYGDLFSEDIVPLKSGDIKKIQYLWLKRVIYNKNRIRNSHHVIRRYYSNSDLINYYKLLYRNPHFSQNDLNRLLN